MTTVNRHREGLGFRRAVGIDRERGALQASTHLEHSSAGRLNGGTIVERQEFAHQRHGTPIRQEGTHPSKHAFVFGCAAVRHEFGQRTERSPQRQTAPAGGKTRSIDLHLAKHRHQTARAVVLDRAGGAATLASTAVFAKGGGLRSDKIALHNRQCRFALGQRQADRRR